ncbi:MAG: 4Fe-4S binding protein [Nitrospiraceae bacterium]|nr:4Fe-4S binding protein [Nitrospiraceae bacterium]
MGRKAADIEKFRRAVQAAVLLLCLFAGYRLYLFVGQFPGGGVQISRPSVVDGFLPIGGLMGLKLWLSTGVFDPVHPAAIVILAAAIAVSAVFKKGFCSWICPVGALSETLWKTGGRISGRDFRPNRPLDYSLRSVKYILLAFFLINVFSMPSGALESFLSGPYWVAADARMLWFFEHMGVASGAVLAGLFAGSFFYRNFWCRYFCPYGALLGLLSFLSPAKVTRDEAACTHCGVCRRNCPAYIPVDKKTRIRSPECSGCLTCVARCPAPGALEVRLGRFRAGQDKIPSVASERGRAVSPFLYAALLLAVFFGIVAWAKAAGHWISGVPIADYGRIISLMRGPGG